jgi:ketosteroid isomerase-like protein
MVRHADQRRLRWHKQLEDNGINVYHIRDGKITEVWLHPTDLYAADEFWS